MVQLVIKKKKKVWYNILSPKDFGDFTIAETLASDPAQLRGRVVKMSLMDLTNDPKKQNVQLTFKVTEVKEKNASSDLIRYELMPSYVRRMMRKERGKVEDSFVAVSKDNIKIRIKPFIITKGKTQRSVLTSIRKRSREFLAEVVKEQKYADFISDAISTKSQKTLREQLKKIYPIAMLEFKAIERA
jgi:small subunit ribosomal protein S3Ae